MEQNPLPIKTKIAAWLMMVIGVVIILFSLFLMLLARAQGYEGPTAAGPAIGIFGCFVGLSVGILPGCLLLLRKKLGWWYGLIIILAVIIGILLTFIL